MHNSLKVPKCYLQGKGVVLSTFTQILQAQTLKQSNLRQTHKIHVEGMIFYIMIRLGISFKIVVHTCVHLHIYKGLGVIGPAMNISSFHHTHLNSYHMLQHESMAVHILCVQKHHLSQKRTCFLIKILYHRYNYCCYTAITENAFNNHQVSRLSLQGNLFHADAIMLSSHIENHTFYHLYSIK